MDFIRKNILKTNRNGIFIATSIVNAANNSSTTIGGNYLPATSNGDGTYTVDLSNVTFTGNIVAEGEVSAYGAGESTNESNVVVYDGLDSSDAAVALSANQGRVLKDLIDNKNVDLSNYYNKTDINNLLAGYTSNKHTHTLEDILDLSLEDYALSSVVNAHTDNSTIHITAAERTNWNNTNTNFNDWFYKDANGCIHSKYNFIGDSEISAYGAGSSSGSGGATVYDGLDSTSTDIALSANQGRILKSLIDNIDVGDIDLSGYYTKTETDSKLSGKSDTGHTHSYLPLSGGTLTSSNVPLTINRTSTGNSSIIFASNGSNVGILGFDTLGNLTVRPNYSSNSNYYNVIHSGNYTDYCAKASHTHNYLPLSGGTITGTLNIQRDSSVIRYYAADGTLQGWLGFTDVNKPSMFANDSKTVYDLIHAGNYTSYFKNYYNSTTSRTKNTVLAAPNGSAGAATFRALVEADIPTLAISKISGLQTALDGKSGTGHTHTTIVGNYTANGGQQPPNYFGKNRVGALMMNTTVNGNSYYKDWLFMDCYSGTDVGGGVAIGVCRQTLGAFIMRSAAARTSWAESAELLGTHNYTTYCAKASHTHNYAGSSTAGGDAYNSDKLDGYHGSSSNTASTYVLRGSSGQINVGAISAAGAITSTGEITAHSDKRLKSNIKPLEVRGELNPVTYIKDGKESIGFIADEVKEVYPELVVTDESTDEKYLSLNYAQLTAVLYAEIKELRKEITELKKKL